MNQIPECTRTVAQCRKTVNSLVYAKNQQGDTTVTVQAAGETWNDKTKSCDISVSAKSAQLSGESTNLCSIFLTGTFEHIYLHSCEYNRLYIQKRLCLLNSRLCAAGEASAVCERRGTHRILSAVCAQRERHELRREPRALELHSHRWAHELLECYIIFRLTLLLWQTARSTLWRNTSNVSTACKTSPWLILSQRTARAQTSQKPTKRWLAVCTHQLPSLLHV